MKKLLSVIISLGLAVSAMPAVTANANINVNDGNSDAYQNLLSNFKEIEMPYFMSHYECTEFDTYYANADGTTFLAVAELTPAVLLNTADSVTVNDVNNALIAFNAETGMKFSVRTRTLLSYACDLKCELTVGGSTDVYISLADTKSLCSYLKDNGLISDLTYVANRIEYRDGYIHTPTSYEVYNETQGNELFETLSAYVAENSLECTVIREDTDEDGTDDYVTVKPDFPLTLSEHISLSEKIYNDTQLSLSYFELTSELRQTGTEIDLLASESETVDTEELERAYTLIKQFVEENRSLGIGLYVDGGYFDYMKYEDPDGAICPDKIECGCEAPFKEQFLELIKPFLAENDIDESLVVFIYLDVALDVAPASAVDTEELERAYTLIKQFIEEQREDRYKIFFRDTQVSMGADYADEDGEVPAEYIGKVVINCIEPDKSVIVPTIKKFMLENDIEEELVTYLFRCIARVAEIGDVNIDYQITVADITYITQYLANPDEFLLSDDQKIAADVTGGDGVTAEDALAIQRYLANEIDTLG